MPRLVYYSQLATPLIWLIVTLFLNMSGAPKENTWGDKGLWILLGVSLYSGIGVFVMERIMKWREQSLREQGKDTDLMRLQIGCAALNVPCLCAMVLWFTGGFPVGYVYALCPISALGVAFWGRRYEHVLSSK